VFDEEGFYSFGDAVKFVDPNDVNKGLLFDGRLNEDFKLANGTWVSVGPLRAKFLSHFAPLVRDVVIAGHDRDFIAVLIFPDLDACAELCLESPPASHLVGATPAAILRNDAVRSRFQELLEGFAEQSTGSTTRVVRAILAEEPPSLDAGEITDKGSFNQRNVLDRRANLVEELYASEPPLHVLRT
jgi:feruloyl-CoA synthase